MRRLNPSTIHPPFANYAHGVEVEPQARIVFCSGQLGVERDGAIPEDVMDQARLCFRAIAEILAARPRRSPISCASTPMSRRPNIWADT